jgi:hypothetical protein
MSKSLPLMPEVPLKVNSLELAFMLHAVWEPSKHGDVVARHLFEKVRAAIIASGVSWEYGHPWQDSH